LLQLWKQGVPIEVVPFAAGHVMSALSRMYASRPSLSSTDTVRVLIQLFCFCVLAFISSLPGASALRMGGAAKAGPVVTDNGNFVVDAVFPPGPSPFLLRG
jgi:ribose 5-phosphate isomerase A